MDDPLGLPPQVSSRSPAFGDLDLQNTDSEGRVAVGGDATMMNFTVNSGAALPPQQSDGLPSLLVG